jgi:trypsin
VINRRPFVIVRPPVSSRRVLGIAAVAALVVTLFLALPLRPAVAERPQVIGGGAATLARWPWVVRVLLYGEGNGTITCTGTVVAPNVVLTAGHCAGDPYTQPATPDLPSQLQVVIGSISATSGGKTFDVSKLVLAPGFQVVAPNNGTGGETDDDAALLQLSTPTTVPAVGLATSGEAALYASGTTVSLAGWGVTAFGASTPAQTLQTAATTIASESQCASQAQSDEVSLDTVDQFCTMSQTALVSVCSGDSGGPLVANGPNGSPAEIGLTVWTSSDVCNPAGADYFTNISALSPWISSEISALATPAPNTPRPGSYRARTSQGRSFVITVAKSRTQINFMAAAGNLRCTRRSGTLAYSGVLRGARYWPRRITREKGLQFVSSLVDPRRWRVSVTATFTNVGRAHGTLTVSGSNRGDGTCKSGTVRWSATLKT